MDINVFAKFDEISSLPVEDIKEKPKRHRWTNGWKDVRMDNMKTVYPHKPFAGGIKTQFAGV